jgi:hypothetical protein
MIWSGSAWGNEPSAATETNLEVVSVAQDVEDFDLAYESLSGDLMLVWADAAGSGTVNGVRYRMCTGGTATCTWGAVTTPPTFTDDATNLSIASNPLTDEIVFASVGDAAGDLQLGYWNGSTWTNTAKADTSCTIPNTSTRKVATGWLISGATTRSVVVYDDLAATTINWFTGNAGVFTKQADFVPTPSLAQNQGYFDFQSNPLSRDQLMLTISDSADTLWAKRLVMSSSGLFTWTNSDGGPIEPNLPQNLNKPFAFGFWQQ